MIRNCRRTVYARVSRLKLNDLLMQFDYPDANVHAEKRVGHHHADAEAVRAQQPVHAAARGGARGTRCTATAEDDDARVAPRLPAALRARTRRRPSARWRSSSFAGAATLRNVALGAIRPASPGLQRDALCGLTSPPAATGRAPLDSPRRCSRRMCAGFGMLGLAGVLGSALGCSRSDSAPRCRTSRRGRSGSSSCS